MKTGELIYRLSRRLPRGIQHVLPDAFVTRREYWRKTGRRLNLANPRGLHEKLCWLKLYGMTPLHGFCSDKITAPAYVRARLGPGHEVPRILVTRDPADIHPGMTAAPRYVIKTNHDCGGTFLIRDPSATDWVALRASLRARLARNFADDYRELQYRDITPAILVEEMLEPGDGSALVDYKLFCFHGRVGQIKVTMIEGDAQRETFVSPDWEELDLRRPKKGHAKIASDLLIRPAELGAMIAAAEHLAEPFPFVRVDLFLVDGRIIAGELTFTPSAGNGVLYPEHWEYDMGDWFDHTVPTRDWEKHLAAARVALPDLTLSRFAPIRTQVADAAAG